MKEEEFKALKKGDKVYLFCLEVSYRTGKLITGLIAEVEKEGDSEFKVDSKFKVTKIISGTSLRVGNIISSSRYSYRCFYKNIEDGANYWNSSIYNLIDALTSSYEDRIKRLKKKLLII